METVDAKYPLRLISKYRSLLMGIAIVMITFCHLDVARRYNGLPGIKLGSLLHLFTVGVDIFMFLSGFGLWYSLSKKNDIRQFLLKRVKKLLPLYFIVAGITYFLYDIVMKNLGFSKFFCDLTFVSWLMVGSTRYWFVAAIFILSMCFPVTYAFVATDSIKDRYKLIGALIVYLIITAYVDLHFEWYKDFKIAIERIPVFVLGAFCAKHSDFSIDRIKLYLLIIMGFVLAGLQLISDGFQAWVSNTHFMYYCIRGLFGLGLTALLIIVLENWSNMPIKITKVFAYLGGITYEIYLFHQSYMILLESPASFGGYLFVAVFLPILSGVILHQCIYI